MGLVTKFHEERSINRSPLQAMLQLQSWTECSGQGAESTEIR